MIQQQGCLEHCGHGILDVDTEELLTISKGDLLTTKVISIKKGEKGNPGEIKGSIVEQKNIGDIYINTPFGIYGKLKDTNALDLSKTNELEVALRDEIKIRTS